MIAVIDYGAGNLQSVVKALNFIGSEAIITKDIEVIKSCDKAVLPGVGSFGDSMDCMKKSGLINPIYDFIDSGKPFLGICLGMQLLFEDSMESPNVSGLGIFKGGFKKIPADCGLKIPHIGWNNLDVKLDQTILKGLPKDPYVYFVHSYYLDCPDKSIVSSQTNYGVTIDASVEKGNIFATQYHPEKSGDIGLTILKNFVNL